MRRGKEEPALIPLTPAHTAPVPGCHYPSNLSLIPLSLSLIPLQFRRNVGQSGLALHTARGQCQVSCQDLGVQTPRNQELREAGKSQEPAERGDLCSPKSCREIPWDPATHSTVGMAPSTGKRPGLVEKRKQSGMESLLSCQGQIWDIPTIPARSRGWEKLGTAWLQPGCSLTPLQGRAVFIFGNIKAEEEVIKLKKPRLLPRGKRCGPGAFRAAGHGHGPAAATAALARKLLQKSLGDTAPAPPKAPRTSLSHQTHGAGAAGTTGGALQEKWEL